MMHEVKYTIFLVLHTFTFLKIFFLLVHPAAWVNDVGRGGSTVYTMVFVFKTIIPTGPTGQTTQW